MTKGLNYRWIVEDLIGEENADNFEIWAFGDVILDKGMVKLAREWNNLHKDLYKIRFNQEGNAYDDLCIMTDLWKQMKNESCQ